jgi:MYXO-CTERM domain-containing protein
MTRRIQPVATQSITIPKTALALAAGAALLVPAFARADLGDFGEAEGATRTYSNLAARIPWENRWSEATPDRMGDWSDAAGVPQGDEAFAEVTLSGRAEVVEIDVTSIVSRWASGDLRADGFFLRGRGGNASVHAREAANEADRPALILEGDGAPVTLVAEADTHLASSTYQALGTRATLSIGRALVRFPREMIVGRTITRALLRLSIARVYSGATSLRVFACRQPRAITPIERGIAAEFEMDRGIASHPDVYTFVDFAGDSWTTPDPRWTGRRGTIVDGTSASDVANGFDELDGPALRAGFLSGETGGLGAKFSFYDSEPPDEIYSRYYLRVGTNFEPRIEAGKMPGIAYRPDNDCNGGDPDFTGTRCWSARGGFWFAVPEGNPAAGLMPLSYYLYWPEQSGAYGEHFFWSRGYNGLVQQGRWYAVEEYVRMNTPGARDGILRAWVNGRLAFDKTDVLFRNSDAIHVGEVWYNIYHGGTTPAPHDMWLYLDNLVIARRYIGPMGGVPDAPPPLEDGTLAEPPPVMPGADAGSAAPPDGGAIAGSDAGTTTTPMIDPADPSPMATGGCSCDASASRADWLVALVAVVLLARRRR